MNAGKAGRPGYCRGQGSALPRPRIRIQCIRGPAAAHRCGVLLVQAQRSPGRAPTSPHDAPSQLIHGWCRSSRVTSCCTAGTWTASRNCRPGALVTLCSYCHSSRPSSTRSEAAVKQPSMSTPGAWLFLSDWGAGPPSFAQHSRSKRNQRRGSSTLQAVFSRRRSRYTNFACRDGKWTRCSTNLEAELQQLVA